MAHNPKVGGSNPPPATNRTLHKTLIFLPGLRKPNEKLNKARPKPSGIPIFRGAKRSVFVANFCPMLVAVKKYDDSRLTSRRYLDRKYQRTLDQLSSWYRDKPVP